MERNYGGLHGGADMNLCVLEKKDKMKNRIMEMYNERLLSAINSL